MTSTVHVTCDTCKTTIESGGVEPVSPRLIDYDEQGERRGTIRNLEGYRPRHGDGPIILRNGLTDECVPCRDSRTELGHRLALRSIELDEAKRLELAALEAEWETSRLATTKADQ